jgi:hypothetical protein
MISGRALQRVGRWRAGPRNGGGRQLIGGSTTCARSEQTQQSRESKRTQPSERTRQSERSQGAAQTKRTQPSERPQWREESERPRPPGNRDDPSGSNEPSGTDGATERTNAQAAGSKRTRRSRTREFKPSCQTNPTLWKSERTQRMEIQRPSGRGSPNEPSGVEAKRFRPNGDPNEPNVADFERRARHDACLRPRRGG